MSATTSTTLLAQVRDPANHLAWAEFHAVYAPLMSTWLRCRGVTSNDANDLQQDALAVVVEQLPHFVHNGRRGAFRNWLRRVVANRIKTWVRQERRFPQEVGARLANLAENLDDAGSDLSRTWDKEHNSFVLNRLLGVASTQFEPRTVAAFREVVLHERPAADVAAELGMSANAVRIAQSRVLAALRVLSADVLDR